MKCFTIFCDTARTFKTRRCCCHDAQSASPLSLQIFSGTRDVRRRRNVISLIARTLKWTLRRKSAAQPPPPSSTKHARSESQDRTRDSAGGRLPEGAASLLFSCTTSQFHFCFVTALCWRPVTCTFTFYFSDRKLTPPLFFQISRARIRSQRTVLFCFVFRTIETRSRGKWELSWDAYIFYRK